MLKGCGEWCRLKDIFNTKFYGMATFVMRSKDESTRNAPLLRCTCGHDKRTFSCDSNGSPYSNKFKVCVP